jgi:hypothetical protein
MGRWLLTGCFYALAHIFDAFTVEARAARISKPTSSWRVPQNACEFFLRQETIQFSVGNCLVIMDH